MCKKISEFPPIDFHMYTRFCRLGADPSPLGQIGLIALQQAVQKKSKSDCLVASVVLISSPKNHDNEDTICHTNSQKLPPIDGYTKKAVKQKAESGTKWPG